MKFVLLNKSPGDKTYSISRPITLIGRSPSCDLVFESKRISRLHCCLATANGRLLVRDLGSTNGVKVNGTATKSSVLKPGDELIVGDWIFGVGQVEDRLAKSIFGPVGDEQLEEADEPIALDEEEPSSSS